MTGGRGGSGHRLRRAGALAALAAALLTATPAAPAGAQPVITVDRPAEGVVLDSATVTVSGRVEAGTALSTFKDVTLTLNGTTFNAPCQNPPCNFTWSPSLPLNGRYELSVSATEQTLILDGGRSTLTRNFVVDAPPAKPMLDAPRITDARTVELSWGRNTEPDMLYYAVFRKDPAGTTYLPVGRVNQPTTGAAVGFIDATTTLNGGEYSYQVVAVRKGGAKAETASAPSSAKAAAVPAPPTTTTAASAPGSPAGQAAAPAPKPGAAAGVDLSGFLASRRQAAPAPPPTILEPPDTGFKGALPFGAAPPSDQIEEGQADAVPPSGRSTSIVGLDVGRPLVPVAGGMILLLLAMHMRVLSRRLRPAVERDLPIESAAAVPPAPVEPEPDLEPGVEPEAEPDHEPEVEVAPPTPFYDVSDDAGWASHWAGTPEPEPEPEPDEVTVRSDADPDDLEVREVISPTRRPLARSGSR